MLDQPHGGGPSRAAPSDPGRHCARTTDVSHRQPSGQIGTSNVLVWSQDQVRPLLGRLGPALALDGTTTAAFPPRSAASLAECQHTSGCFKPPASPHLTATQGRTQNKRLAEAQPPSTYRGSRAEPFAARLHIRRVSNFMRRYQVQIPKPPGLARAVCTITDAKDRTKSYDWSRLTTARPMATTKQQQRRARERETISSPGYARHGMTVNCFCRFHLSTFTTLRLYEFTQPTTCVSIITDSAPSLTPRHRHRHLHPFFQPFPTKTNPPR